MEAFEQGFPEYSEFNQENSAESKPTIEQIENEFFGAIEISDHEEIIPVFQNMHNEPFVKISIPVASTNEENRKIELARIGEQLRKAIFDYTGLSKNSEIGKDIYGIIGEATSDIEKHTIANAKFNKILISVNKAGHELKFHLINPAKNDVNLDTIEYDSNADPRDAYDEEAHGTNLARKLEDDLSNKGCSTRDTKEVVVDKEKNTVAVKREIGIECSQESIPQ